MHAMRVVALQRFHAVRNADDGILEVPAGRMARSCLQVVLGNCHSEATSVAKIACLIPTGLTCGNEASVQTSAEHIRLGSEVERLLCLAKWRTCGSFRNSLSSSLFCSFVVTCFVLNLVKSGGTTQNSLLGDTSRHLPVIVLCQYKLWVGELHISIP